MVDAQFKLLSAGIEPFGTLLFEHGAPLYNNVVAVLEEFLVAERPLLDDWLTASRLGWEENFRDPAHYPKALRGSLLDASRTLDNELFANRLYQPLIASDTGILTMTPEAIRANVECLERMGFSEPQAMFAAD